jgi:hypothetical protein
MSIPPAEVGLRGLAAYLRTKRWSQVAVLALGAGALASAIVEGAGPLIAYVIGAPIVLLVARAAAEPRDRAFLVQLSMLALGVRGVLAAVLHAALIASGNPWGGMFQDDAGYAITAGALAKAWRGLPISGRESDLLLDPSVANTYSGLAAVLLFAFGGSILALKVVNEIQGAIHASLVYRTMRNVGLPGARIGAIAVAFFPSLLLWSVLVLKDATALTLMFAAIWSVTEFQRSGRWWPWLATVLSLFLLRDVRLYLFTILVVAWPLGLFVAARRRAAGVALVASLVLLMLSSNAFHLFAPEILNFATFTRGWMAQGARSAFVESPPIAEATPGQAYRVAVPGLTQDPNVASRRIEVSPGTQLTTDCSATPQPIFGQTARPLVCVRPGDIVVIGKAAAGGPRTPESSNPPPPTPVPELAVRQDYVNVVMTAPPVITSEDKFDFDTGVMSNLRHFPVGTVFLLVAPFPLFARSLSEIALTPDTLLWYLCVVLSVLAVVRLVRRRDWRFAMGVLVMGAITLVLILIEGNVGTLVRHRAMLIPLVAMLAAAEAVQRFAWVRSIEERLGRSSAEA